ncbi:MAG: 6-carboxytetrahydropterin synthase [Deltaproteobacteria bacterium]|nr:6-carboxytetrahydropterin synthase [Deltaproteobacteria bacterium]
MYTIAIELPFSAAHQLRFANGEMEPLHGHNWKVKIEVSKESLDSQGLVIDFEELKKTTQGIIQRLNYTFINEVPPFDKVNPSAENLAFHIYQELHRELKKEAVRIEKVTVWETEDAQATYIA